MTPVRGTVRMLRLLLLAPVLAAALACGGCAVGAFGAVGTPIASAPPAPPVPAPVSYGCFLEGPVGMKLSAADRDKALAAEQDAAASGQRKTWKGTNGVFGYVEPAAVSGASDTTGEVCRPFTSTVYLGGRPQVGHGRGCQTPDGGGRIVG